MQGRKEEEKYWPEGRGPPAAGARFPRRRRLSARDATRLPAVTSIAVKRRLAANYTAAIVIEICLLTSKHLYSVTWQYRDIDHILTSMIDHRKYG